MEWNSLMPQCQLYEVLRKILELGNQVIEYLFHVEENLLDCPVLVSLEKLFESEIHDLRVVNGDLLKNFIHMECLFGFDLVFCQPHELRQPQKERFKWYELNYAVQGLDYGLVSLKG